MLGMDVECFQDFAGPASPESEPLAESTLRQVPKRSRFLAQFVSPTYLLNYINDPGNNYLFPSIKARK